jgi:pimeloyl-ACP methyl ester carboxylesterase
MHGRSQLVALAICLVAACSGSTDTNPAAGDTTPLASSSTSAPTTVSQAVSDTEPPTESTISQPTTSQALDNAAPTTRRLDCAEQLPDYVESRIPDGVGNPRLSCWALDVPENYGDPTGRRIDVTYYVWESATPAAERPADPIAYLPGGPRGSAYNTLRVYTERNLQGDRDLILMDTRGNGPVGGDPLGLPQSGCPEVYAAVLDVFSVNEPLADEYERYLTGWTACQERLASDGWDLSQYNSINVVNDLEQLRRVLGYEQWNFFGESYSTLYGQQYMRAYPGSLRSVVLDSVTVPDADWSPQGLVGPTQTMFEYAIDQCAAAPACAAAHPDPQASLDAAVERLDAVPHSVDVTSNVTGETITLRLDGADLGFILDGALSPDTMPLIPGALDAFAAGDFALLDTFAQQFQDNAAGGLMTSAAVVCGDNGADPTRLFTDIAQVQDLDRVWQHVGMLPNMLCAAVPVQPAPPSFAELVIVRTPTLVVIGSLDTATDAAGSRRVAGVLPDALVVEFVVQGHVPVRSNDCALAVTVAFWDDLAATDTGCVDVANAVPLEFGA